MPVLIGTSGGLYRADEIPFSRVDRVLDCGNTHRLRRLDGTEGVFAATERGLFRSADRGQSWDAVPTPGDDIWEAFAVGGRTYVGAQPVGLFVSAGLGETWGELESLHDHPSRDLWRSAHGEPRLRTIAGHPDAPDRLFAGVEAGGLFVTGDAGETWAKCRIRARNTVQQTDIHQIVPVTAEEYLVACGRLSIYDPNHAMADGGLYRTRDAGTTWRRLDADLGPNYYREVLLHEGRLYASGALTVPPEWPAIGAQASLFESRDMGDSFERVSYPGGPDEIVNAWAAEDDTVLGGTAAGPEGRIIERRDDGRWVMAGAVPESVRSMFIV